VGNPYENISGVRNGSNNSGSDHELFPTLSDIDNVNSLVITFVHVWSHQAGAVLSTNVDLNSSNGRKKYLGSEHKSDILLLGL
jgi:hypothetical protein